jgi:uncharacterized protein YvpB
MRESEVKKRFSWLTLFGTFFALFVCIVATGMVYVVYPQSSQFIKIFFRQNLTDQHQLSSDLNQALTPTPFLPATLEVIGPAPTLTPEIIPTETPSATSIPTAQPTNVPINTSVDVPDYAYINGIYGSPQLYTLDCEAQAAVDWARFFGIHIDELEFIDRLPRSDDPTMGFVGNINGPMGQIPPGDYGVYTGPVADLLRTYGLNAQAVKGWSVDSIKKEIAAGRPVIVWIVNLPFAVETSQYTASNGNTTTVAKFEHTWIVTGYNNSTFTVIDSEWTYNVMTATFIERWNALGNMAIIMSND